VLHHRFSRGWKRRRRRGKRKRRRGKRKRRGRKERDAKESGNKDWKKSAQWKEKSFFQ